MEVQPSTNTDSGVYQDCENGTQFVADFDITASTNVEQDLGSDADTDLDLITSNHDSDDSGIYH